MVIAAARRDRRERGCCKNRLLEFDSGRIEVFFRFRNPAAKPLRCRGLREFLAQDVAHARPTWLESSHHQSKTISPFSYLSISKS